MRIALGEMGVSIRVRFAHCTARDGVSIRFRFAHRTGRDGVSIRVKFGVRAMVSYLR